MRQVTNEARLAQQEKAELQRKLADERELRETIRRDTRKLQMEKLSGEAELQTLKVRTSISPAFYSIPRHVGEVRRPSLPLRPRLRYLPPSVFNPLGIDIKLPHFYADNWLQFQNDVTGPDEIFHQPEHCRHR